MMTLKMMRRAVACCAIAVAAMLTGCGKYTLVGKVVAGDYTNIEFLSADDPRLAMPGIGGAQVSILRDPETPKRAIAGSTSSDQFGMFEMPVEGIGAGWMIENWLIRAERSGYQTAASIVAIPANPKRMHVLITMRRGSGSSMPESEDLMQDLERFR